MKEGAGDPIQKRPWTREADTIEGLSPLRAGKEDAFFHLNHAASLN